MWSEQRKMNRITASKILAFILIAIAIASFVYAEEVTYIYKSVNDDILATDTISVPNTVVVNLPDTTWKLDFVNNNSKFRIHIPTLNSSEAPQLNIKARELDLGIQNYDGDVGLNSGTYRAKYAYAFNISELPSKSYELYIDYTDYAADITEPKLFQCDFNFITNTTNTSTCTLLTTSASNNIASATTTGFSSFFITQDTSSPAGGTTGGGGGGGGGGGLGGPTTIYVTPTPEGESVQVIRGDLLVVQFKGDEYRFRVTTVGHHKVELKSLESYMTYTIELGDWKTIGLTSFFNRDIEVSMYVSNQFAVLTFKTIEKPTFSFNLLPPRPRRPAPEEATAPQPFVAPAPRPAPVAAPAPAESEPEELQVPESPIGIWTIVAALVFIIFLVGGIALYRVKLHHLEKPPTVTRTGLEPTGLPETSSKGSEPAPVLKPEAVEEIPAKRPEAKPKPVEISKAKKLELEKYIFHAYSLGFKEEHVMKALIEKGWPTQVVEQIIKEIKPKK